MNSLNSQDIIGISNLYIMYNEICNFYYQKKDYNNLLKYFHKLSKYFDILYSNLTTNESHNIEQIEGFKLGFLEMKKLADISNEEIKGLTENINTDALDKYEQIFYNQKDRASAYYELAQQLYEDSIYVSALNFLKNSMQLTPEKYENYNLLGILYNKVNDNRRAILCYEKYNEHFPRNPLVYNAIGALYSELDRFDYFDIRIENFKKAIEIDPNCDDAIRNLAFTYRNADNVEESMKYFKKLIDLNPTNDDYYNYGHMKLRIRDFQEGFKYFAYRFDRGVFSIMHPKFDAPKLTKDIDFTDKTILIHYEQGFGDTIQFCRYLFQLKAKKIIFKVQDELVNLLRLNLSNVKNIEIVAKSTPIETLSFEYYIMLMDVLSLIDTTADNIPLSKGYISADAAKIEAYRKEYFNNNDLKIGITWHGKPKGAENRNISLSNFHSLSKLKNVKIYSFQKGFDDDLENLPDDVNIVNLGKTFNDFSDTAAAMANVDLLISTDNVIANLAGAMGKKTFLLLFEDADWRWFDNDEISPWYDSVRIFRGKNKKENINLTIQNISEIISFK